MSERTISLDVPENQPLQRFFFDIFAREGLMRDDRGIQLSGAEEVRGAALAVLMDLAYEAGLAQVNETVMINVRDEDGNSVLEATVPIAPEALH